MTKISAIASIKAYVYLNTQYYVKQRNAEEVKMYKNEYSRL